MDSNRPRPKRSYTLPKLQAAVKAKLDLDSAHLPPERRLCPPAMPTLKLWSMQDVFAGAHSLEEGVALVVQTILKNPGRYQSRKSPEPSSGEARQSASGNAVEIGDLVSVVLGLQREMGLISSELKRLNDIVNSKPAVEEPEKSSAGQASPEITRAVEQLDAVRKHTLVSYDREVQLMRQQGSTHQINKFEGASALDIQRVLARLSNVEGLSNRILDRLDSR